jgi:hypothetical protein
MKGEEGSLQPFHKFTAIDEIAFEQVFGPEDPEAHSYYIIQDDTSHDEAYCILRCDVHGTHFGLSPLRAARIHLETKLHG